WEPLHVEKGFEREQSCVSAVGVTGTQNILDYATQTPRGMLQTLCSALTFGGMQNVQLGWGPVIGLCPEHAQIIASGGYSKADCKRHLYEHARLRRSDLSRELFEDVIQRRRPVWVTSDNPDDLITVADHWDDFTIVVVGGPGPHSAIMPTFGESTCVSTKLVRG
ncbi:MAG: hypothetical protein HY329_04250, partial [Chloroflexi bacterium]|nr:hypothetical protein [Chloroflexota bacterium]